MPLVLFCCFIQEFVEKTYFPMVSALINMMLLPKQPFHFSVLRLFIRPSMGIFCFSFIHW